MKLRSYFVFAAMALSWAAVLNAQQSFGQRRSRPSLAAFPKARNDNNARPTLVRAS